MIESEETSLPWTVGELGALAADLGSSSAPAETPGECLARIEALEALKGAVAAAQVRVTEAYAVVERRRLERLRLQRLDGEPGERRPPPPEPVVGAQLGLVRRESPARGRFLTLASATLVHDLPHTLAALARGELNEERALLVVRETSDLSPEDRRTLDAELADGVGAMGSAELRAAVQRVALRLDEAGATERMRRARARRHVAGRLLGDGTGRITAVLKSEHYGAVLAALREAAASARAAGDERTSDQVRADVLVERVTGIDAVASRRTELHLVMSLSSLLCESTEPGWVPGAGHLPAGVCRDLFAEAAEADLATVRRLFTLPDDGQLVAMESDHRFFTGLLARMVRLRDGGTCRTPWCDAPVRHVDHVVPDREDGPTTFENGQGLCEACNLVKEAPGWLNWVGWRGGGPDIGTITTNGRVYRSKPPPLAG